LRNQEWRCSPWQLYRYWDRCVMDGDNGNFRRRGCGRLRFATAAAHRKDRGEHRRQRSLQKRLSQTHESTSRYTQRPLVTALSES
jgi:hypothetical protein